jgi:diguanylate cyclase (GGDEF)-like protein
MPYTQKHEREAMKEKPAIHAWITTDPATVKPQEKLAAVVRVMAERRIGAILVAETGKLVGIFSERDLLNLISSAPESVLEHAVERYMTRDPVCAQTTDDFNTVYQKMQTHHIRHIPVLSGRKIVGIVSLRDLVRFYQHSIETSYSDARREVEALKKLSGLSGNDRLKSLQEELDRYRELSLTDSLTGLYNKRYFQVRLQEEVSRARRFDLKLSLIFADIDHFKDVNDRHGHQCGDEVLKEAAGLLAEGIGELNVLSRLRKTDIIARYGGEEFVIILPETDTGGAVIVAERLRCDVAGYTFRRCREPVRLSMSFGVAELSESHSELEELIHNADQAMYTAKHGGRNAVKAWSSAAS